MTATEEGRVIAKFYHMSVEINFLSYDIKMMHLAISNVRRKVCLPNFLR